MFIIAGCKGSIFCVHTTKKLKNEKRVCLKRIIKGQENQVVKRKVKMNPKLKTRKVASQNATTKLIWQYHVIQVLLLITLDGWPNNLNWTMPWLNCLLQNRECLLTKQLKLGR